MTVGAHFPERGPERLDLLKWMEGEFKYADDKFDDQRNGHDTEMKAQGLDNSGFWQRQILQYIDRARLFGMDTPQGRQALAKCLMTVFGACESAIRVYGPLPKPGVSSGNIEEWHRQPATAVDGVTPVVDGRTWPV